MVTLDNHWTMKYEQTYEKLMKNASDKVWQHSNYFGSKAVFATLKISVGHFGPASKIFGQTGSFLAGPINMYKRNASNFCQSTGPASRQFHRTGQIFARHCLQSDDFREDCKSHLYCSSIDKAHQNSLTNELEQTRDADERIQ